MNSYTRKHHPVGNRFVTLCDCLVLDKEDQAMDVAFDSDLNDPSEYGLVEFHTDSRICEFYNVDRIHYTKWCNEVISKKGEMSLEDACIFFPNYKDDYMDAVEFLSYLEKRGCDMCAWEHACPENNECRFCGKHFK